MTRAEIQATYDAGPEVVSALVERLLATVAQWQAVVEQQQPTIVALTARVHHLENQLALHSRNRHKPPSSDGPGPCGKGRKGGQGAVSTAAGNPGGQSGHPGHTLEMVDDPQHTVTHFPEQWPCCAASLAEVEAQTIERRQMFDLPPEALEVTEHQGGAGRASVGGGADHAAAVGEGAGGASVRGGS